jgi:hypothetical protein
LIILLPLLFNARYSAVPRSIRRLFSPAVNPGDNFDEQKPGNARQSKEEIKVVWHRSPLSVEGEREQCQCRHEKVGRTVLIGIGFLKNPSMANAVMP